MQILSAEQIRAWDGYTIKHEAISSIDLMERAARKCVEWIRTQAWASKPVFVFCGKGNNGGDGLAMARMLLKAGYNVSVYILEFGRLGSEDFQTNLQRWHELPEANIHFIQNETQFPAIQKTDLVVDALFGSGLNKPLDGFAALLVKHLNQSEAVVIAIDLPSGLLMDKSSLGHAVTKADYTLTFQCYKEALLLQENAAFVGQVHVLDIGLHPAFLQQIQTPVQLLNEGMIKKLFRPRNRFAHKGNFGHALLVGGSYGKMGAVVLATKACMAAGAGLTFTFIPKCGYQILQTTAPEAMTLIDEEEDFLTSLPHEMDRYNAVGIGPGMGTKEETQKLLSFIVRRYQKPAVIDADGLNCLAKNQELLQQLPSRSILTPHPKEFDRLFGEHKSDFDRIATARKKAVEHSVVLVLKSHHTLVALPTGESYYNSTGNAGMAKGGSGDVLTGILTALLAQGYQPELAAQLGVYIHGWAGDFAAKRFSKEAMLPSHLVDCLADVFLALNR